MLLELKAHVSGPEKMEVGTLPKFHSFTSRCFSGFRHRSLVCLSLVIAYLGTLTSLPTGNRDFEAPTAYVLF